MCWCMTFSLLLKARPSRRSPGASLRSAKNGGRRGAFSGIRTIRKFCRRPTRVERSASPPFLAERQRRQEGTPPPPAPSEKKKSWFTHISFHHPRSSILFHAELVEAHSIRFARLVCTHRAEDPQAPSTPFTGSIDLQAPSIPPQVHQHGSQEREEVSQGRSFRFLRDTQAGCHPC